MSALAYHHKELVTFLKEVRDTTSELSIITPHSNEEKLFNLIIKRGDKRIKQVKAAREIDVSAPHLRKKIQKNLNKSLKSFSYKYGIKPPIQLYFNTLEYYPGGHFACCEVKDNASRSQNFVQLEELHEKLENTRQKLRLTSQPGKLKYLRNMKNVLKWEDKIINEDDAGYNVLTEPTNPFVEKYSASVYLNSISEVIIPRIFLHFFDMHFLREKGFKNEISLFVDELKLATRIAISTSKIILIPAPSYIESPICRNIINMHEELFPYGIIFIVGNASCIEEFAANRLPMYPKGSSHYTAYSNISTYNMYPPFRTRKRNTTHDISLNWINTLEYNDFFSSLQERLGLSLPSDFEDMWRKVPDSLEGRAIIYDHISPLFKNVASHLSFKFQITSLLNGFYFDSYVTELDAGVVGDLIYLKSDNVVPSNGYTISYAKFITRLRENGIYDDFAKSVGWKLLEFRNSPLWLDCYLCSLSKADGNILK